METGQSIIKDRSFVRMWRIITGKLACCACGHWERARNEQTRASGGRKWYCVSCGELIRQTRTGFYLELFIFFLALGVTIPLFGRILDWLVPEDASEWFGLIWLVSWFLTAFLIAAYLRAHFDDTTSTKVVRPHGHCLNCDYDLNYAVSDRCPECGASASHVIAAITKRQGRNPVATNDQ